MKRYGSVPPGLARHGVVAKAATTIVGLASILTVAATGAAGAAVAHPSASTAKGSLSAAAASTIQADLNAAARPSRFVAPGPALDAKGLKGKKIFMLTDGSENQFEQSFISGVTAAAKAVGMTFTMGNGNDVVSQDDQLLQNTVNSHVSVIMLSAESPSTFSSALLKVKAAHIPVIETFIGDPHVPTAAEKKLGVYADATYCYSCTGKLSAEWEILKTGGKVNSMVQQYPGLVSSDSVVLGWKETLNKFCPKTCSISYDNVTIGTQTVQEIQSGTQVAAQNPKINTIFPVYDYQMGYMLPELSAAQAGDRIDLLSENADLAQMQEMAQGTAVKVDVGNPVAWDGWSAVDEALRALKHMPPIANEEVPVRLFDVSNVKSVNLNVNPANWYGTATYGLDYEKLWGLR